MKAICLFNYTSIFGGSTTKDKIYEVLEESTIGTKEVYYIKKDNGQKDWIIKSYFITLEDYREQQLKQLGI